MQKFLLPVVRELIRETFLLRILQGFDDPYAVSIEQAAIVGIIPVEAPALSRCVLCGCRKQVFFAILMLVISLLSSMIQ
jgi:hypothetical protein